MLMYGKEATFLTEGSRDTQMRKRNYILTTATWPIAQATMRVLHRIGSTGSKPEAKAMT